MRIKKQALSAVFFMTVVLLFIGCGENNKKNRVEQEVANTKMQLDTQLEQMKGIQFKSYSATVVDQGQTITREYTSAPDMKVQDKKDSILVGMGQSHAILYASNVKKGLYESFPKADDTHTKIKAYRSLKTGVIDSVTIFGLQGGGSTIIRYKLAK